MKKILSIFLAVIMLISVFGAALTAWADADEKNGFVRENGAVYYYVSGDRQAERWVSWNGNLYYVKEDGKVAANELYWVSKNNSYYYFNSKGIMQKGSLVKHYLTETDEYSSQTVTVSVTYLAAANGRIYQGWKEINGNLYYFGPEMYKDGIHEINGYKFYFAHNGILKTGFIKDVVWHPTGWCETNYYCATKKGVILKGWQTINGNKYYFDANGRMYKDGVREINGKKYLFGNNGALLTDGLQKVLLPDILPRATYYYTNKYGIIQVGWKKINGKQYYFQAEKDSWNYGQMIRNGSLRIGKKLYVFGQNGVQITSSGWAKISYSYEDGSTFTDYYYLSNGVAKTGWQKINSNKYYFDPDSGEMYRCGGRWVVNGDDWTTYVFEANGALTKKTGWVSIKSYDGKSTFKYYVLKGGIAKKGFKKSGDNYYWLDGDSGRMATGAWAMDGNAGKVLYFTNKGVWVKNKTGWVKEIYTYGDGTATTEYYYFVNGVAKKCGWKKIGDNYYYFDSWGVASTGVSDGYFFTDRGVWVKNKSGFVKDKGNDGKIYFYYFVNGRTVTGWKKIGGKTYFFDEYGKMCRNGIYEIGNSRYYFNENGVYVN